MLRWDGLHFLPPASLEPVALHHGYLRLVGEGLSLELRFGAEKRPFDAYRDGMRLQRSAGLVATGLQSCRSATAAALPGALYGEDRLYAYRLAEGAVAALLYSRTPAFEEVVSLVGTMQWTPPERWRQWTYLDLAFVSPPKMLLREARFVPGSLSITLHRGDSVVTLSRHAPADILLAGAGLAAFGGTLMAGLDAGELRTLGDDLVAFHRPCSPWRILSPIFPWLGRGLRGRIRHDRQTNKILLIIERGRLLPEDDYQRIVESYVASEQG